MKILYKGNVFNPTGMATANREIVSALIKLGHQVQVVDPWNENWEFNKGKENWNNAIGIDKETYTIFSDYPQYWREGYGKISGHFLHEGTVLLPNWADMMNSVEKLYVPSEATRNLFKWNGVTTPIKVIPYGTNPEIYNPLQERDDEEFIFLSVNSWTGQQKDRKGTDILIKAFDEEFKDEKVKLVLKVSTFWEKKELEYYVSAVLDLLGHTNPNILINSEYMPEKDLAEIYKVSDCFVSPTRGEAFGLTILNAMACGLPVIVTKDRNSGHMDFCKGDSVLFIDAPKMEQADMKFFAEGNMQPIPDKESLKKQMRYAFTHPELKSRAIAKSDEIRETYTWENTAKEIIKWIQ